MPRAVLRRQGPLAGEAAVRVDGHVAVLDQIQVVRALALDKQALAPLEHLAPKRVDEHALLAPGQLGQARHLGALLQQPARLALRFLGGEGDPGPVAVDLGLVR